MRRTASSIFHQPALGLLLLRIFIGGRLFYGVADNLVSWEQMQHFAGFLAANGFPLPTASAVLSVYAQAIGGLLLLVGWGTRWAAAVLAINFAIALLMVHRHHSVEEMTPPAAMLVGSLTLLFTGAGTFSLDSKTGNAAGRG